MSTETISPAATTTGGQKQKFICYEHLHGMIADGQMLAGYISRQNFEFEGRDEAIATVLSAAESVKDGKFCAREAASFMKAYSKLTGAIRPATVSSLENHWTSVWRMVPGGPPRHVGCARDGA
jgi:hypothetical protein